MPPPLDYENPPDAADTSGASAALVLLPATAGLVTFIAAGHSLHEEPFGFFEWSDAVTRVGGLVAAFVLWIAWALIARRARVRTVVLIPVAAWAVIHLWFAWWLGYGYFREPWNV
ncbi:MAG: hypothetical protein ACAI43_04970 [Phycisphaerae bacterium]|nr:hypothetical protein [Tepidisphaeraceae bacterium]